MEQQVTNRELVRDYELGVGGGCFTLFQERDNKKYTLTETLGSQWYGHGDMEANALHFFPTWFSELL